MGEQSAVLLSGEQEKNRKKQIRLLMDLLAGYAGFRTTDNLEKKLEKALRNMPSHELDAWIIRLSHPGGRGELDSLVEDLTNHETYFFRDAVQFKVLQDKLLPEHFSNRKRGKFRIWSAACASGEEAYTLAILAAEFALNNKLARWNMNGELEFDTDFSVEVQGSDISRQAIRKAMDGIYSRFGLSSFRDMPEQYWKYFRKVEPCTGHGNSEHFQLIDSIKQLVRFDRHNLMDSAVSRFGRFDLIVCRNLFIYIDEISQKKIQKNFEEVLFSGGSLIFSAVDRLHDKRAFKQNWVGNSLFLNKK